MSTITYEELCQRLTPEALALFQDMVAAHLESTGDRRFLRSDTMSGTSLTFTGEGTRRQFESVDVGALQDVVSYGLLHVEYGRRGTPNYRVSGEAQRLHRWLTEAQGSPLAQTEHEIRHVVDSDAFAAAHPAGSHHLREAFALLWSGRTDEPTVSEIGDHLRKALMDATTEVVGSAAGGAQEKPVQRLKQQLATLNIPAREADVFAQVVELARVVLRLDHRLNHIRDEADQGEPPATWEETRRAAFATALVCYELDRLQAR